jgi:DNA-directed RNA polymerase specialized sigma24 family protein
MASSDSLDDGQRALLQLLLRRGKSYDELAGVLKTDAADVRARARSAVAALAPDGSDIAPARRHEIADYLLGQQSASQRAATREYLEGSAPGRSWARAASAGLAPVAGDALPDIPAEREEVAEAFDALAHRTARQAEVLRSSKLGTRLLIAGAGVIVGIIIILALGLGGGDDPQPAATTPSPVSTSAAVQTTPTGDRYQIVAQGTLLAPEGGDANAKGQVAIFRFPESNQYRFGLQASGLTPSQRGWAYGVWLYSSDDKKQFLGFPDTKVGKNGKLETVSDLSPDTPAYGAVLLTRETSDKPTKPGRVVLAAQMVTAAELAEQQKQRTQTATTPAP